MGECVSILTDHLGTSRGLKSYGQTVCIMRDSLTQMLQTETASGTRQVLRVSEMGVKQ